MKILNDVTFFVPIPIVRLCEIQIYSIKILCADFLVDFAKSPVPSPSLSLCNYCGPWNRDVVRF